MEEIAKEMAIELAKIHLEWMENRPSYPEFIAEDEA